MTSRWVASVIATWPGSITCSIRVATPGASPMIESPSPVSRSPTIAWPLWIAAQGTSPIPRLGRSRSLSPTTRFGDRQRGVDRAAGGVLVCDGEAEARLQPLRGRHRHRPTHPDHGLAAALAKFEHQLMLVFRVEGR